MNLAEEVHQHDLLKVRIQPVVKCTAFEDNSGALELARSPKMRPRTKHINVKYHHFRSHVGQGPGKIQIEAISTSDQLADIFMKAVSVDLFFKFRAAILGW